MSEQRQGSRSLNRRDVAIILEGDAAVALQQKEIFVGLAANTGC